MHDTHAYGAVGEDGGPGLCHAVREWLREHPDWTEVYRAEVLEALKQRNDNAASISSREWNALMYGEDHFEAREPTKQSVESLTIDDMREFHAKVFNRANLIIGVSGDFEESAMLEMLERATADMARGTPNPEPPAPTAQVEPGVARGAIARARHR